MNKNLLIGVILLLLTAPPVAAKFLIPYTPEEMQAQRDSSDLLNQGEVLLSQGDNQTAEDDFKQAIALDKMNDPAKAGLAEALTAQGKDAEALDAYRDLLNLPPRSFSSTAEDITTLMPYAILLSRTGHWGEAIAIYNKSLPHTDFGTVPDWRIDFDPLVPKPAQLQASAHIALGRNYALARGVPEKGFVEFAKALRLQPDSPLTSYYYGFGWQRLYPKDRAKLAAQPGQREAVKAALEKAAKLGTPDVSAAAKAELKSLR